MNELPSIYPKTSGMRVKGACGSMGIKIVHPKEEILDVLICDIGSSEDGIPANFRAL
jgi:hypothetical protein